MSTLTYELIDDKPDFLIIHKYPNVSFNDESKSDGLFHIIQNDFPKYTLHAVHRLDKVTSGILIIAKNSNSAKSLSMQFRDGSVEKYYLAISDKKPKKKQGKITGDMERSRRSSWKLLPRKTNPAITQFFSFSIGNGKRLFVLKPNTGKTHQLRVMMKSVGSPILGDTLYTGKASDRTYLHAYYIQFKCNNKVCTYTALPKTGREYIGYMKDIELVGNPSDLNWPK